MSSGRVNFFILELEGSVETVDDPNFILTEFLGHFDSPDKIKTYLKEGNRGYVLTDAVDNFSRYIVTKQKTNDPSETVLIMSLDQDGDEVEWGYKKKDV